ncbi:hypothetical protein RUM43_010663 [Polyplax serrata]|uniref:Ribosome production factor 2 homolog n=1 Tax=Polyplax serrata TaxID=468196 RepID=A0AAN8PKU5_POLSC
MFLRGRKTNERLTSCMKDIYVYKKPDALMMSKKNDIVPFENAVPLEDFSRKLDMSLLVFGYSSKKRPNSLILGRTFDHQILDMIELGIENYKSIKEFAAEKVATGIKPCLLFAGEEFKTNPELNRLQNLFVDLFQREKVDSLSMQGLEHVIMFTTHNNKIYFRSYRILLKKSGTILPRVELEEIGPSIDFKLQRSKLATPDLFKRACKQPLELKAKKVKNISVDPFGTTHARIHVPKQNIQNLQIKKMKALRRTPQEKKLAKKEKKQSEKIEESV